jgi:hypothetical protein
MRAFIRCPASSLGTDCGGLLLFAGRIKGEDVDFEGHAAIPCYGSHLPKLTMSENEKIIRVVAEEDFVEKLTVAGPAQALAELIWNGLDAEATKVSVEADNSPFGLKAIRVRDNGHGIPPQDAEGLFVHLGGSWKRSANKSKNGARVLHGKEGKGRFRALALGRVAEWSVTTQNDANQLMRYRMTVIKDSAKEFRLTPASFIDGDAKPEIEVTISEPFKQWRLDAPSIFQELNEIYMLYAVQ